MKKVKLLITSLFVGMAALTASGCAAFHQGGHCRADSAHHDHKRLHQIMAQLDLNSDQKAQIKALKKQMRDSAQADSPLKGMKLFFTPAGFDKEGFKKEAAAKMAKRVDQGADMIEKIYAILTKEQKEKLISLL